MKKPFSPTLAIGLVLAGLLSAAHAQLSPKNHAPKPEYDKRAPAPQKSEALTRTQQSLSRLKSQLPAAAVDFDELLGTPKFARAQDGFLTGPDGEGRAVSSKALAAIPVSDPDRAVKAFLNEQSSLYGYGAETLDSAKITRTSVTPHNGLRTVVWQQQLDGIPVFESVLIGNTTKRGELVSLSSQFLPNLSQIADAGTPNRAALQASPQISATDAILKAAADLGETWDAVKVTATGKRVGDGYAEFTTPRAAYARLVWLPLDRSRLRLSWEVMLDSHELVPHRYVVLIDAQDGQSWLRRSLTRYISDATYNVYTSDSPSPFSPGWPTPNAAQPPLVPRVMVTTPAFDVNASPDGWIPDGGNTTTGNNVDAFVDRDFNQAPDQARPAGNPNRVFNFPQDLTMDPSTYIDATTVQLFYGANYYHDRLYELGFTESAGNFQENNFGKGGLGNDRVIAYAQSGADIGIANNSMFATPPDGFSGQCFMFVFDFPNPARDGSLDTDVLYHELTHGTSGRLVGGGVGISALQTGGMGEGWSDFYALSLVSEPSDDVDGAYAEGGYVTYQFAGLAENYYYGIRHYPYCTDMSKNPFTFKDIDPTQISPHPGVPLSPLYSPFFPGEAGEVHHQGEVWCVTLWDVRANLIHKYGFSGNQLMLQLATDGMKLGPANPTFLQARDAILLADRVNNGGVNLPQIWRGFAKRGMGASAVCPPANTTVGVVEGYDVPILSIDSITLSGGNGNGIIDVNECNTLQIALFNNSDVTATHIVGRLSTTTPGAIVAAPVSSYPDTLPGNTNVNLIPFRINTSPEFVCGTPIDFTLVAKCDQETRTFNFRLRTGTNGTPIRFDSSGAVAIPDANPFGASSPITVSGISGAIKKVSVGLYLSHTFDSDLYISLIAPDGTTNVLSANEGFSGDNFGIGCGDSTRTIFDDDATNSIAGGAPPFVGPFRPETPFVVFEGKSGANVNGTWQLHAVDQVFFDSGVIQCWSLFLSPAVCVDGGGQCPGLDLAIGMVPNPEPVFVGSNLVYTITITNLGPNEAKNVVLSQVLPSTAVFVSATISRGGISHSGGVVTGNIGNMGVGDVVTATVTVLPTQSGLLSTTASVTSAGPENDPANNTVTVTSHVVPPFADLAVGLLDAPDPTTVGQVLTYTVTVTNRGPSPASFVTVTNTLPTSVGIIDATPSQGFVTISGNVVVCNFGTITNSGIATATINVSPIVEGTIVATAIATAAQTDPIQGNNTATATTVVGPSTDLAIGIVDVPDPVVLRSNLTYIISVTNRGPSSASGVVINDTLPAGVSVVSTNSSQGTISVSGSTVTAALGSLTNGARASLTIVVTSTNSGTFFNTANVTGDQADPVPSNNSATATTVISPPFVSFVAERAVLTFESIAPTNGTVDHGETVTVNLYLRNAGNVANTNLFATLLAINGVTSPSGTQNYGTLAPSVTTNRPFSFTASGSAGDSIVATLQLQDINIAQNITNNLGTVAFTFILPTTVTFANTNRIDIPSTSQDQLQPGPASPYPSPITVSGVTGLVGKVTVTLSNFNHTFPHDVNLLLVGPTGIKSLLMSDAADGPSGATAVDITFDDSAPAAIPASGAITSGAWKPSVYDPSPTFTNPAPAGPYNSVLSVFNGPITNGDWSLYANDDSTGDFGAVVDGWALTFTILNPVNQISDLLVAASASPNPVLAGNNLTNVFSVTNAGPNDASFVWVTNTLSPNVALISADNSMHAAFTTNGNNLICNIGGLEAGASAKFTLVVSPTAAGSITNTASVTATSGEVDLNPANNTASAIVTANLPQADLGLAISASPNPVTVGSNLTTTITVTNAGPNAALNVVVSNTIPAGVSYVFGSAGASQGAVSNLSGVIIAGLGTLPSGSSATVTFREATFSAGSVTNTARVSSLATDGNSANNSASAIAAVLNPAPLILVPAVNLTSESISANGTLDAGETVTGSFTFTNAGAANTLNLVATLLATNGVTSPSAPVNLGALAHGGATASGSFSFTAGSAPSGTITAMFQLQDGANDLGLATFSFNLPNTSIFQNVTAITIPDHGPASPYPSTIAVSGLSGVVGKVTVSLNGLSHGFPDDIDLLLVSPSGQKVVLMSDAGGGHSITNVNLTFDDSAASGLPDAGQIVSDRYKPTDFEPGDNFPPPAPAGAVSTFLSAFNGSNPNGNWSLYAVDDTTGDAGLITSWSIAITTITPASAADNLVVTLTDSPDPVFVGAGLTYSITLTNRGPSAATGVYLTDILAPGVVLVSSNTTFGTFSLAPTTVTINVGTLSSGAGLVATLRVSPSVAGVIANNVSATNSPAQIDLDPSSNLASVNTTVLSPLPAVLSIEPVANHQLLISVTAEPNQVYTVQGSADLATWSPVFTGTVPPSGIMKFTVPNSSNYQFFRAIRVP